MRLQHVSLEITQIGSTHNALLGRKNRAGSNTKRLDGRYAEGHTCQFALDPRSMYVSDLVLNSGDDALLRSKVKLLRSCLTRRETAKVCWRSLKGFQCWMIWCVSLLCGMGVTATLEASSPRTRNASLRRSSCGRKRGAA
jgi:hypothetical protein